ncbi:hypothetical protein ASD54_08760 [Rhizobium sp. Root149]|uniref:terminase gpA endonuclease subunit n=1 Tax=Rhizobium sp. Root149 TaxID=1736473 RepID=UPI0007142528|nr:terminase gpA endonuclease subunit [Rhizobium sp. Root149]KQZ50336.1 hypothetical protein ASD54_08760 [Rhizobium sp. Root149]
MLYDHSSFSIDHLDFSEALTLFNEGCDRLRNTALQIPPPRDPSEWVAENIELPEAKTYKPGYVKFTGYQRPIAKAFMSEGVSEVVVLKGTRVGWSLFIGGMSAYALAYKGFPIGIVQPTRGQAEEFYKKVIEPLLRTVPALKAIRRKAGRGDTQDTMLDHIFKNQAEMKITGAARSNALRGWRGMWLFGDEYSAPPWADDPGDLDEGDKANLLKQRGGEWADSILALGSTPTFVDECRTYARWLGSDQRLPYLQCPHCGLWQNFKWGDEDTEYGFKFKRDENNYVTECFYQCEGPEHCRIDERHKYDMVENVDYRPSCVAKVRGRVGFHVPQWLSMAGKAGWINLAQEWVDSKGNPSLRKAWFNTVAGWPFDDFTASSLEASDLSALLARYTAEVPDDVVVLTVGGDTQTNKEGSNLEQLGSREVSVVGWNRYGQFRIIGHWVILGAPGEPEADRQLRELLDRKFYKRDGTEMKIVASALDGGGHYTDQVRSFAAKYPQNRNVWAIHGSAHRRPTVWPRKAKRGSTFYMIDSHLARDAVFHLLQFTGNNRALIPHKLGTGYLNRLMCEERKRVKGKLKWVPKRGERPEEEWMCLAYAYAALKGLQTSYPSKWSDLNLAADKAGIVAIPHDPETGEIFEPTEDMSVPATEKAPVNTQLDAAVTEAATIHEVRRVVKEKETRPQTATVPPPAVGKEKRQPRAGGVIKSSRPRRW